tara:strand:- start:4951 stop:7851 length:2901 start_codon:yes stop_codon:yes gene_type:complete
MFSLNKVMADNVSSRQQSYRKQLNKSRNAQQNIRRQQFGYLQAPLVVDEGIVKAIKVSHMKPFNKNMNYSAPQIEENSFMADFVFKDLKERAKSIVIGFCLKRDIALQVDSMLSRAFYEHLNTYYRLVEDVTKEAKRALVAKINPSTKPITPEDFEEKKKRQKELENKIKQLKERSILFNKAQFTIQNIKNKVKRPTLKTGQAMRARELIKKYDNELRNVNKQLNGTYVAALPKNNINTCPGGVQVKTFDYEGKISNTCTSIFSNNKAVGATGGNNNKNTHRPFKTIYGDRLMKRWLTKHSFIDALDRIFPKSNPLEKRYKNLIASNDDSNDKKTTEWNAELRTFGQGPQEHWMQLVREMYDARRMKHVRKLVSIVSRTTGKPKSDNAIVYEINKKLSNNLGVTEYGYACANVQYPEKTWRKSYHRFGRSWFCLDEDSHNDQLPFGCYMDRFAPKSGNATNVNHFTVRASTPSGIRDKLERIVINNLITTVLQKDKNLGTQGRFQHIRTKYKNQSFSQMNPREAYQIFLTLREYTSAELKRLLLQARGTQSNFRNNLNANFRQKRNQKNGKNNTNAREQYARNMLNAKKDPGAVTKYLKTKERMTPSSIRDDKMAEIGGGLARSTNKELDAAILNDNFMLVDGDILVSSESDYIATGGSPKDLGIRGSLEEQTKLTTKMKLIIPVVSDGVEYQALQARCKRFCDSFADDAASGIEGLVNRYMENVCMPLLRSGGIMRGTHYNDLQVRLSKMYNYAKLKNGKDVDDLFRSPKLINILKCLQFYLYLHIGETTRSAVEKIKDQEARRNAYELKLQIYSLTKKFRMIGDSGPIGSTDFKQIVRQHLLTGEMNYKSIADVDKEVEDLRIKLETFAPLGFGGKRFLRRSFLPSFLGGTQTANRRMLKPSASANKLVTRAKTGTALDNAFLTPRAMLQNLRKRNFTMPTRTQQKARNIRLTRNRANEAQRVR